MNRGFFRVSEELIASPEWLLINSELEKVFTFEHRVKRIHGIFEFHGKSELFAVTPIEGSTPEYDCTFTTRDGKPAFEGFNPVINYYSDKNLLLDSGTVSPNKYREHFS
jgi:hypothetical protein